MKAVTRIHGGVQHVWYHCPGCKHLHGVPSERWNWNGDTEMPTLWPSVRHFIPAGEWGPEKTTCHYFVLGGLIKYCGDCEHELAGKTMPMVDAENVPDPS